MESYFTTDVIIALVVAILYSFGIFRTIHTFIIQKIRISPTLLCADQILKYAFLFVILFFSSVYLVSLTYNPFIYYQF